MRRLLAWFIEALCRYGDPAVMRYADLTDDADLADGWDDYGYHPDAPTPNPTRGQNRGNNPTAG